MRVKRYVVNTVPEALPMIRSELGKDAVILNTKEIQVGGFLGMFRKKKMEVIAAVESGFSGGGNPQLPRPAARQTAMPAAPVAFSGVPAAVGAAAALVAEKPVIRADEHQGSRSVDAAPEAPPSEPPASSRQDALLEEIMQMKEMVVRISKQQIQSELPAALKQLYNRLAWQEVDEEWILKLIEAVQDDAQYDPGGSQSEVWRIAANILIDWIRPLEDNGISSSVRIVHFVGPTGVGKTTTIAKLAAEQTLKHKRKVGFITSDTYRIAAVDQLRTYANILNVPLEVVFSPSDLTRAFKQLETNELIFMDTAGRNFRNELYVSEINSLLQSGEHTETYLVLSLTGKSKDMYSVAELFARYGVNKVLFTKLDETETCGAILNLLLKHQYQPAYVACGQNVPDDIEPFKADRYVERLLGAALND
ncbi:flagellar biosynthesis protein FlhF [Paenibacillus tarimensis]